MKAPLTLILTAPGLVIASLNRPARASDEAPAGCEVTAEESMVEVMMGLSEAKWESKIQAIETVGVAISGQWVAVPSLTAYISFCPFAEEDGGGTGDEPRIRPRLSVWMLVADWQCRSGAWGLFAAVCHWGFDPVVYTGSFADCMAGYLVNTGGSWPFHSIIPCVFHSTPR